MCFLLSASLCSSDKILVISKTFVERISRPLKAEKFINTSVIHHAREEEELGENMEGRLVSPNSKNCGEDRKKFKLFQILEEIM